jgi:hypothetical protein
MHRVLSDKAFASIDEANAFLQSAQFKRQLDNSPAPATSFERAQQAAYDAWEMSPPRRYELARQALSLDDRCSDAWPILAEQERTWIKQRRHFEKAVAAAERAAQEEGWLREAPSPTASTGTFPPARSFEPRCRSRAF